MKLQALPTEILLQISAQLPWRPMIRLGATCRQLRHLVVDLIPQTLIARGRLPPLLYFALMRNDFVVFSRLCIIFCRKLRSTQQFFCLPDTHHGVALAELDDLKDSLLACVYELVVIRADTGKEWWPPLVALGFVLDSAQSALCAQTFLAQPQVHVVRQDSGDRFPSHRIIEDAVLNRHFDALSHLYQPSPLQSKLWPFLLFRDMSPFFSRLCRIPLGHNWTASDRSEAIALLMRTFSASKCNIFGYESMLGLCHGYRYRFFPALPDSGSDDDVEERGDEPSIDHCVPLDALVSTNDLALIVSVVIQHSSSVSIPAFRIHTRQLLDSCLANGNSHLFSLFMTSYLVAVTKHKPQPTYNFDFLIESAITVDQLYDSFASHGVSQSEFATFLKILSGTSLATDLVSWLLGDCPPSTHAHLRIDWLLNHIHLHPSTLHYLPFHSSNLQSPQCVQLILDRIPIDFACTDMHKQQDFEPSTLSRNPAMHCARCDSIAKACVPRYFDPHLARFASRIWVVSVDPIRKAQLRNEARAVAALVADVPVEKDAQSWAEYYDLVRNGMLPARISALQGDAAARSGSTTASARSGTVGTCVLWVGSPGSFKVNAVDCRSLALQMLFFWEFDEIVGLVQKVLRGSLDASAVGAMFKFDGHWVKELSKIHGTVLGIVKKSVAETEVREYGEILAQIRRLAALVDEQDLWDESVRISRGLMKLMGAVNRAVE